MSEGNPAKIDFQNKRFALAVRDAARYASARDRTLEEHVSQRPEIKAEMERLNSQGLDPTAWLNVISIPGLFRIDEKTSSGSLLAEIFTLCELDHRKPRHWRILLDALVEQCFRGAGAPQKWDEGGLVELLGDIRAVQTRFPGTKRKTELAKLLRTKEPFKKKYNKLDRETLRKVVGKALDPKLNPAASLADGEDWITFRAQKAAEKFGLPTELGVAAQMANLEQLVIEDVRDSFFKKRRGKATEVVESEWQEFLPAAREFAKTEAERIRKI